MTELNEEYPQPGFDWHVVARIWSKDGRRLERAFHAVFASRRVTRGKEWFTLGASEIELFKALDPERAAHEPEGEHSRFREQIIQRLKEQRKVRVAAIFDSAVLVSHTRGVLTVRFPETLSVMAHIARDHRFTEMLLNAVETVYGSRPEIRVEVEGA